GHALDLPVLTGGGSRLATTRRCRLRSPLRTGSGTLRLPTLGLDHDIGHRCVLGTIAVHELPDHIRDDLVHLALDLVRVALGLLQLTDALAQFRLSVLDLVTH